MQYIPDNYDMFLQHETEQERRRRIEEELYGSGEDFWLEDGDTDFD